MGTPDAEGHSPSDGLPDLPPHWGRLVIPDDASALAEEAAQLRRELRRRGTATRQPASTLRPDERRRLALPALVLLVTLLTTIAALAGVTWPRSPRDPGQPHVPPYASSSTPPDLTGRPLPALDLVDADQSPVPLRRLLPAMIILLDVCACAEQVATATTTAPAGVRVITVTGGRTVDPGTAGGGAHALADPAGGLRGALRLAPTPGTAPA
ncbi:hypothetical protein, partial [Micromonospora sp. KC723]|uniref:hypothetical protein n=1 Tax=Micromonospora sp. KC723 TaxID=2530381 RepID=UPI00104623DD